MSPRQCWRKQSLERSWRCETCSVNIQPWLRRSFLVSRTCTSTPNSSVTCWRLITWCDWQLAIGQCRRLRLDPGVGYFVVHCRYTKQSTLFKLSLVPCGRLPHETSVHRSRDPAPAFLLVGCDHVTQTRSPIGRFGVMCCHFCASAKFSI